MDGSVLRKAENMICSVYPKEDMLGGINYDVFRLFLIRYTKLDEYKNSGKPRQHTYSNESDNHRWNIQPIADIP